jgi:SAM-dependent methyltransferase
VTDPNLAWWEERAALHGDDGAFYDVDGFLAGDDALSARELGELEAAAGSLGGIDLLHVQCHLGLGTLSIARRGARVVGLDFSPTAVARASEVARRAGIDAAFRVADAQHLPDELAGRFDCVFASYGVLLWIADLAAWMRSAASALRPGGSLVLVEGHPIAMMVRSVDPPVLEDPYGGAEPQRRHRPGDYAQADAPTTVNETIEFRHDLGEVVTEAASAGLRIDALTEWFDTDAATSGDMFTEAADGRAHLILGGGRLPVEYALRASMPR